MGDSQSRAGRSLCPAEARYSLIAHSRGPHRLRPENFPINDACGSLNRAVRRRPTAADCNSLCARSVLRRRRTARQKPKMQSAGLRGPQAAARTTVPRSGVIFGGSRKARPPQPPKINFAQATSTKSKQVCFCIRLIRIFGFALDTPSRHNQTFGLLLRSTFRIFASL